MSLSARCEADWVSNWSGGKPFDAIVGAYVEEPGATVFYFCRAYYEGSVQPGWAVEGSALCHFSYGGLELTSVDFDWSVPSWTYSYGRAKPANAIPFGSEPVNGVNTYRYPCRVGPTPGKYGQDFDACYVPYGGREVHQAGSGFSWLVDPGNNVAAPAMDYDNMNSDFVDGMILGPYFTYGVQSNDEFPADAIVAGLDADGTPLYACTAFYQDGLQPGKARRDWNACDVSWGGSEHYDAATYSGFVVLTPAWALINSSCSYTSAPCIPPSANPIPAGTDSDGSTLYACQGYIGGRYVPGKTKISWNGTCSIAANGVENWILPIDGTLMLTDGYRSR
jgi:hypothetical protein